MPNTPSNVSLNSMPYASGIIIVTMVALRIMPSWMTFARQGKPSPSVVSEPITRMGWGGGGGGGGGAERRIHDITESARTMLLHAARWPKTITSNLWPQALKHATNVQNVLPRKGKAQSPISLFSNTTIEPNIKHFHPFRCPVYILQAPLQTGAPFPKWNKQSRVGIFLCHSPHHATSVPFILSTQTGLVSPQFHCVFDDQFKTVKNEPNDTSVWQKKAYFCKHISDKTNNLLIS